MTKTLLDRIDHLIQYYKDEDTSHNYGDLDVAKELEEIREEWNKWNAVIDDLEMTVRSYMVKVDGLESALAAEKEGNRWIPIAQKPKDGDYLVSCENDEAVGGGFWQDIAEYYRGCWYDGMHEEYEYTDHIKYYRPLPPPPEEREG